MKDPAFELRYFHHLSQVMQIMCDGLDPYKLEHMCMLDQSDVIGEGLDPYTNWDTHTELVLDEAYCIKFCFLSRYMNT